MNIPSHLKKVRDVSVTAQELIDFESRVRDTYEAGKISGPIHLAKNNEKELLKEVLEKNTYWRWEPPMQKEPCGPAFFFFAKQLDRRQFSS